MTKLTTYYETGGYEKKFNIKHHMSLKDAQLYAIKISKILKSFVSIMKNGINLEIYHNGNRKG